MSVGNQFDTGDYIGQFVGLHRTMARVSFPAPFTVGDYRSWFRAMNPGDAPEPTDDVDQIVLLRQYRAAMAVATVEPYAPGELAESYVMAGALDEEPDEFRFVPTGALFQHMPVDTAVVDPAYDDLPMPWVSFMVQIAEEYIGDRVITGVVGDRVTTQQRLEVFQRRSASTHRLPSFNHDYVSSLLPAINLHRGFVTYREPLTKSWYRRWVKATATNKNIHPTDVNNGRFLRTLRGAVSLVEQFHFRDLSWAKLTAKDCEDMPLEIACFLVETCDEYLSRRMTIKN